MSEPKPEANGTARVVQTIANSPVALLIMASIAWPLMMGFTVALLMPTWVGIAISSLETVTEEKGQSIENTTRNIATPVIAGVSDSLPKQNDFQDLQEIRDAMKGLRLGTITRSMIDKDEEKILTTILNDSNQAVRNVRIAVSVRDETGKLIDVIDKTLDGFPSLMPGESHDCYIKRDLLSAEQEAVKLAKKKAEEDDDIDELDDSGEVVVDEGGEPIKRKPKDPLIGFPITVKIVSCSLIVDEDRVDDRTLQSTASTLMKRKR